MWSQIKRVGKEQFFTVLQDRVVKDKSHRISQNAKLQNDPGHPIVKSRGLLI
jgi:hypothetical protein